MYEGFETSPFQYAVRPVAPPYAPESFERPAPIPGVFTQVPSNLPGPIFFAPGWHYGPSVHAEGYGADTDAKTGWAALGTGTKVGLIAAGALALGAIALAFGAFKKPKTRKNRKNPRHKSYPFYVVRKSDGAVLSGWDYQSDAKDDLRDNLDYYPEAKVLSRVGVKRLYGQIKWAKA